MNKVVTPKQLELTAGKTREDLLVQSLPSHINPESPALRADLAKVDKIERQEAARTVLAAPGPIEFAHPFEGDDEDFDWNNPDEESIVLREQRATAIYRNKAQELIIRQRAGIYDDQDTFVYLTPENEVTFMEALAKRARES
jgi:hypothetical protein